MVWDIINKQVIQLLNGGNSKPMQNVKNTTT